MGLVCRGWGLVVFRLYPPVPGWEVPVLRAASPGCRVRWNLRKWDADVLGRGVAGGALWAVAVVPVQRDFCVPWEGGFWT